MKLSQVGIYLALVIFAICMVGVTSASGADSPALVRDAYPTLTTGALTQARLADLPAGVILQSGDMKLTQKDLDADIRQSPKEQWPQLKRNLFFVLENATTQILMGYEASQWAQKNKVNPKDGAELLKSYMSSLTSSLSVSDSEVKSFYDNNKDMVGGATCEQVKDQLKDYVLEQKRSQAISMYIADLCRRYEVEVSKTWVAKQYNVAMDNPVDKARKSGMPTMVDFGASIA